MVAPVAHGSPMAHGVHHPRHANFGALNSAVRHGDFEAAQQAYDALSESSLPSAVAVRARGSIEAIGQALNSGDIESVREAVAAFRSHRTLAEPAAEEPVAEEVPVDVPAVEEPVEQPPAIAEGTVEVPVVEEPAVELPAVETPAPQSPVESLLDAISSDQPPEEPGIDLLA